MTTILRIAHAALLLSTAAGATAQEERSPVVFGVSAGIVRTIQGTFDRGGVDLWLRIDRERLRLEPTLSVSASRSEVPGSGATTNTTSIGAGIAVLHEVARAERSTVHAGGVARFTLERLNPAVGSAASRYGLGLGALVSGEYFVAPVFSVGAEAGVAVTASAWNRIADNSVGLTTSGRLVARYHFR